MKSCRKCSQNICARLINKLTMQRNIVLDTNCLLQIIARKSKNYFLWEGFLNGDYCLCFTTEILEEYEEILCLKTNRLIATMVLEIITQAPNTQRVDAHIIGILSHRIPMIISLWIVQSLLMPISLYQMINISKI